jgi:hypothetical protein
MKIENNKRYNSCRIFGTPPRFFGGDVSGTFSAQHPHPGPLFAPQYDWAKIHRLRIGGREHPYLEPGWHNGPDYPPIEIGLVTEATEVDRTSWRCWQCQQSVHLQRPLSTFRRHWRTFLGGQCGSLSARVLCRGRRANSERHQLES